MTHHFNLVRLFVATFLLVGSSAAFAQSAKVGFVDVGRILEDSPQATAARQELQNEFAPRNKQLEELQKEITELEKQLTTDGDVMSEERRVELERNIQRRKRSFARAREEAREDFAIRRNEELSNLQEEVNTVVENIAKEDGYDLILTQAVALYASSRIDITERVLKKLSNP